MRKKICIALAIIWMGVIFYMSNQPASISSIHSGNTINIISKLPIIGNIMDYLTSINIGEFIVRKCAHMFSYCILAILLFMSVYEDNIKKAIIIAFLGTFLYGNFRTVENRSPNLQLSLISVLGIKTVLIPLHTK